jgi:hypothetical protein
LLLPWRVERLILSGRMAQTGPGEGGRDAEGPIVLVDQVDDGEGRTTA